MSDNNNKIAVTFTKITPKKHSIRFDCEEPKPAITALYINKESLEKLGQIDKGIKVTIEKL